MERKSVLIIYTGGTFGMRATNKGYVPAPNLRDLLHKRIPELGDPTMPLMDLLEYEEPLESSNANPDDWTDLAGLIRKSASEFDGFVVIHGTDTLAYTASALSFLLADVSVPIILTGAQIPLSEIRSDAQGNLINALYAIASEQIEEVGLCFGRFILRGNRTTKINARELDAFATPNYPALAEIGTELSFPLVHDVPAIRDPFDPSKIGRLDHCVGVLRLYPGISAAMIEAIARTNPAGLVLQCYGVGTGPTSNVEFTDALRAITDAGTVVVAVSECREGRVTLDRYAAGSALADAGVISGADMTTEAALTKLHALFAQGLTCTEVTQLAQANLCGELTS